MATQVAKTNSTVATQMISEGYEIVPNSTGDPCMNLQDAIDRPLPTSDYTVVDWVDYYDANHVLIGSPRPKKKH